MSFPRVMRGLDRASMVLGRKIDSAAWIAGLSPAKTRQVRFSSLERALSRRTRKDAPEDVDSRLLEFQVRRRPRHRDFKP